MKRFRALVTACLLLIGSASASAPAPALVLAPAQTGRPIPASRFVNDGKPYNIVPENGDRWAKQRACPYFYCVEGEAENRLSLNATAFCSRKGAVTRRLTLNFTQVVKAKGVRDEPVALDLADSELVLQRLQEALHAGRTWQTRRAPTEAKTVAFHPAARLAIVLSKTADVATDYPVVVRWGETGTGKTPIDITFGKLDDFAAFVSTFEEYRTWLKGL